MVTNLQTISGEKAWGEGSSASTPVIIRAVDRFLKPVCKPVSKIVLPGTRCTGSKFLKQAKNSSIVHDVVVISNFARVRHLFIFSFSVSPEVETSWDLFCPLPLYMTLFRAPFSIVFYVPLPPNCEAYGISPRFRQSGPSSPWSWSVSSFVFFVILFLVAASCRILYCLILFASRIWSHRV